MTWHTDYTTEDFVHPVTVTINYDIDPVEAALRVVEELREHGLDYVCQRPTCSLCIWRGVGYMSDRGVTRGNSR